MCELGLRDNAISELPSSVGGLRSLRRLDLRNNGLRTLPDELAGLPALDKLDLRWNRDLAEPAWLGELAGRGCVVWRSGDQNLQPDACSLTAIFSSFSAVLRCSSRFP